MGQENKEFGEERLTSDSADVETKSCTEVDSNTSSSVDAEANENVVNLCDVLKEFMQRHPDACAEETDSLGAGGLDIEELRIFVRTNLEQAARNGNLHAALSEAKPPKTKDAHVYPQTEIVAKRTEVPPEKACKDQRDVLSEARAAILAAAFDGRLAAAVEETIRERPKPSVDELRVMLKQTLSTAAADGRLNIAITEAKKESLEDIRLLAQQALSKANEDGSLQRAFRNLQADSVEESSHDPIECKVGDMASGGLRILSDGIEEAKDLSGLDEMRSSVKQLLSEAASNGALFKALTEARLCADLAPEKTVGTIDKLSLDEIRGSVRQVLVEAVTNGALRNALADAKLGPQQPLQPVKPSGTQPLDYGMIMKLRSTFVRAASSGRLAAVLKEVKKPEEYAVQVLRQQVKLILSTSEQDGRLANALSKMGQSNPKLHMPSNAATDAAGTAEVTTGVPLISSSKRNRRIMGGISREPAVSHPEPPAPSAPPSFPSTKPGKQSMVSAFRMDIYGGSAIANPSVPLGYDDVDDGFEDSQWSIPSPHGVSHLRVPPGSTLRSHPHRPRTPKSSSSRSAMALDLDQQEHSSPSASRQAEFSTLALQPLGSARVTKGFPKLPSIVGKGKVSYPICDLGLSAHQWDVSGALL